MIPTDLTMITYDAARMADALYGDDATQDKMIELLDQAQNKIETALQAIASDDRYDALRRVIYTLLWLYLTDGPETQLRQIWPRP